MTDKSNRPDLHALADRWVDEAAIHRECQTGPEAQYHEAYADSCIAGARQLRECLAAPPAPCPKCEDDKRTGEAVERLLVAPPAPNEKLRALFASAPVSPPAPSSVALALPDGWRYDEQDDRTYKGPGGLCVYDEDDCGSTVVVEYDSDRYRPESLKHSPLVQLDIPVAVIRALLSLESAEAPQPAPMERLREFVGQLRDGTVPPPPDDMLPLLREAAAATPQTDTAAWARDLAADICPAPEAPQVTRDEPPPGWCVDEFSDGWTAFLCDCNEPLPPCESKAESVRAAWAKYDAGYGYAPTPSVGDPLAPLVDEVIEAWDERRERPARMNAAIEALRGAR